jgi:hypothetical protein
VRSFSATVPPRPATQARSPSPALVTTSPPPPTNATPVPFAESLALLVLAVVAAMGFFFAFDATPIMDAPGHAALFATRHRFAASPFEQEHLVYAPMLGPYSLFRGLGELFYRLLGAEGAVRVVYALPVAAIPAATLFMRRRLHGDRSAAFGHLALALSLGLMLLFGLASFLLAAAVFLVVTTLWLELLAATTRSENTVSREAVLAAAACFLFLAHGHAFVLFLAVAPAMALVDGPRMPRLLRLRTFGPAVALAAYVAWSTRPGTAPADAVLRTDAPGLHFQGILDKLSLLVTPTLMTRWGVDVAIGLVLAGAIAFGVHATARSLTADALARDARGHVRGLFAAATVLALLFFVLPHEIGWFGFVDARLVPLVEWLLLGALVEPALGARTKRALYTFAPLFSFALVAIDLTAAARFQREAEGFREVAQALPPGSRLLNLPLDPNSDVFTSHPFVHYNKYAQMQRPVITSDTWFHQGSAVYPRRGNPALALPRDYVSSNLHGLDWSAYALDDWDYVLVRVKPTGTFPAPPHSLTPVVEQGGWHLFRTQAAATRLGP